MNINPFHNPNSPPAASFDPARIFVVVPTYNEAENLPLLAASIFALQIPELHLLVVDDNSPDGTGKVAEQLMERYPERVHVIHRPGKHGLGTAYRQGFRYALEAGASRIVQMDADFSHSPEYLPEMISKANQAAVVVGSRYIAQGALDPTWSFDRHLLSWWANSVYVRWILGLHVQDATAGFKCWNSWALRAVLAYPVSSQGYIFQVEMAYVAEKIGLDALEIPIFFSRATKWDFENVAAHQARSGS